MKIVTVGTMNLSNSILVGEIWYFSIREPSLYVLFICHF